jgi:membrane-bound serine protease (ClpP class)
VNAAEARTRGIVRNPLPDETVPVLRNMLLALDDLEWQGRTVQTTQQITADDGTLRVELVAAPRLFKLGLLAQLMHSVASVPVAYLLMTIGLCLLLFEFFTAGIGVAGAVGAVCLALGCYGLAALPTRGWAVALMVVALLAFAIDVQTGVPRFWTSAGMVLFTLSSLFLFRGVRLSWLSLLVGIGGVALTFFSGMPSMVRTRFATPTIGREWMIGAPGEAVSAVDPDGVVKVGEGTWRARTNRATPVPVGGRVRVVAIDGVTLEVEPEEGAARDYRERRGSDNAATRGEETRA